MKTAFVTKHKKKTSDGVSLPKTAQETIPYVHVYNSGIIESAPEFYTKSYKLTDLNFSIASQDNQESIFNKYQEMLNSFESGTRLQLVVNNKNISEEETFGNIECKAQRDEFNSYRSEMNTILRKNMAEGRNGITSEKYLVVGTKLDNIKDAATFFARTDTAINEHFRNISGIADLKTEPQSIAERLKILHDILNVGKERSLEEDHIDLQTFAAKNISTKDIITPSGFKFDDNMFRVGDKYACILFAKDYPSSFSTDFMGELSALPINLVASFTMDTLAMDEVNKKISRRMTGIRANVIDAEKKAFKDGYSGNLISPELKHAQEQSEELLDRIRGNNQKLFDFTMTIMHVADTKEELNNNTKKIIALGSKYMLILNKLSYQQEIGFRSTLPLGLNELTIKRSMKTEDVSLFLPFTTRELTQKGGMYYGINPSSNNMIIFNRLAAKNQNGLIVGVPGSGKSFTAKREMINVFLTTNDDIMIIDPEGEYTPIAKAFNGTVINLEPGSGVYLNPFDMDIQYGDEDGRKGNPVTMKSDFIGMLCETALGNGHELNSIEKSIVDRVVTKLYRPYLEHMQRDIQDRSVTCDRLASPTMDSFHDALEAEGEPEAHNIALAIEMYAIGNFDTFAHRTRVDGDINNRFIVYNIKNIGTGMKEMGLQVCLNDIWNKIIDNQKRGKRTWFYIDEFHVLTKTKSSADFLMQIWKRARKWGGIPTAITQNITDLMTSESSMAILSNTEFIIMLSQSPVDRENLATMYHISDSQLSYITNSGPGQGLIHTGETIVPFVDKFPRNTKLYSIMTSKADERQAS